MAAAVDRVREAGVAACRGAAGQAGAARVGMAIPRDMPRQDERAESIHAADDRRGKLDAA